MRERGQRSGVRAPVSACAPAGRPPATTAAHAWTNHGQAWRSTSTPWTPAWIVFLQLGLFLDVVAAQSGPCVNTLSQQPLELGWVDSTQDEKAIKGHFQAKVNESQRQSSQVNGQSTVGQRPVVAAVDHR